MHIPNRYTILKSFLLAVVNRFHADIYALDAKEQTITLLRHFDTDEFPLLDTEIDQKIDPSTGMHHEMNDEKIKMRVGMKLFKDIGAFLEYEMRHDGFAHIVSFSEARHQDPIKSVIPQTVRDKVISLPGMYKDKTPLELIAILAETDEATVKYRILRDNKPPVAQVNIGKPIN